MERFVIIVNVFQSLIIITKRSILDVAAALDQPLDLIFKKSLIWGKSKWSSVYFQYISIALNLPYNKNRLYKTLDL